MRTRTQWEKRSYHCSIRHGERSVHDFKASAVHAVDLSVWHTLQALGIFNVSVLAGPTKRKV
jgi:hypothetical protein